MQIYIFENVTQHNYNRKLLYETYFCIFFHVAIVVCNFARNVLKFARNA